MLLQMALFHSFYGWVIFHCGLPRWFSGKEFTCQCRRCRRHKFNPWVGTIPWRRKATHSSILTWAVPWDRGAWLATVHGVEKSQIRLSDWAVFHCIYIMHLLYSFIFDGYLGCFCVLAIVNSAAMNIGVHVSFWNIVFIFSRYLSRSGIAGSYCNSTFSFLRNLSEDFFVDLSRV